MAEHIKDRWPLAWKQTDRMVRRDYNRIFEERNALLAACEAVVRYADHLADPIQYEDAKSVLSKCQAAIAKAKNAEPTD